jgi:hypothetical protein
MLYELCGHFGKPIHARLMRCIGKQKIENGKNVARFLNGIIFQGDSVKIWADS